MIVRSNGHQTEYTCMTNEQPPHKMNQEQQVSPEFKVANKRYLRTWKIALGKCGHASNS